MEEYYAFSFENPLSTWSSIITSSALQTAHNPSIIIYNILTNAYKFTPSGGHVFIQYQLTNTNLQIIIEDDGKGISEEEQGKIFDAYYKGNKEVNSKGYNFAFMASPESCTGCTNCATVCPDTCITVYRIKV